MLCKHLNLRTHRRCSRSAPHGYLCAFHLRRVHGLVVKTSLIAGAGLGLFTTIDRCRGDYVVEYEGRKLETKPRARYVYTGPYVLQISRHVYIDAARVHDGVGRYMNCWKSGNKITSTKQRNENNLSFELHKNKRPYAVASHNIAAGEELLVDYGQNYWD